MTDCIIRRTEIVTGDIGAPDDIAIKGIDLIDRRHGAPFTAGVGEVWQSEPFDFGGEHEAVVCLVLEGSLHLDDRRTGQQQDVEAGDVFYIGEKHGEDVFCSTREYGKYFFVCHPHWR